MNVFIIESVTFEGMTMIDSKVEKVYKYLESCIEYIYENHSEYSESDFNVHSDGTRSWEFLDGSNERESYTNIYITEHIVE